MAALASAESMGATLDLGCSLRQLRRSFESRRSDEIDIVGDDFEAETECPQTYRSFLETSFAAEAASFFET
jgi:hypothetical protein